MPKVQDAGGGAVRPARGRRVASTLSEINVVPLVDVMLVLLIIFMVTAPMLQRGIDVKLPQSRRSAAVEGARVFITIPRTFRQTQTLYLDDEAVRVSVFRERVRQALEGKTDKQVYLRGDEGVPYQDLMAVIDELKDAGVVNVGLLAAEAGR